MKRYGKALLALTVLALVGLLIAEPPFGEASSHREAPLIADDPLADNTDLYAFRSPDRPNMVTIIADYIPFEAPEGGPNYFQPGENVRYEVHIKNDPTTTGDDITYRFTFDIVNEDPTTFFNIRLGKRNLKASYTLEKSTDGGQSFTTIVSDGYVPPPNIGPRSIENGTVGLGTTYEALTEQAILTASSGERVFVGPRDDPFFVDLGGIFDVGNVRDDFGPATNPENARDGVAGYNTHAMALQIPIAMLQKDGLSESQVANILDPDYVIAVWASASRPQIKTLSTTGEKPTYSGDWVQVSRLGMPLTNEVVIPLGEKDRWNALTPYEEGSEFNEYFYNPELALYMDDDQFGGAVPGLAPLRIQRNSLGAFDFGNGQDGLYGLKGNAALDGTALAENQFGALLLPGPGQPRSVDLWPIFYTGVPNARPYQLATGKNGDPLAQGKPFIHNFFPVPGDMLRLNMAVPPTQRNDPNFSSLGLVQAAVLGLTDPTYSGLNLEFIPNMDGFPNGRRLQDDVTRIELQAVSGVVLAAIGLWYDDYVPGTSPSPVTQDLANVLGFVAGPVQNDVPLRSSFPYLANPHNGYSYVKQLSALPPGTSVSVEPGLGLNVPEAFILDQNYPNPFNPATNIQYHVKNAGNLAVRVYDVQGRLVETLVDQQHAAGTYEVQWDASGLSSGTYFYRLELNGRALPAKKALLVK